jgi:hypothetical protein
MFSGMSYWLLLHRQNKKNLHLKWRKKHFSTEVTRSAADDASPVHCGYTSHTGLVFRDRNDGRRSVRQWRRRTIRTESPRRSSALFVPTRKEIRTGNNHKKHYRPTEKIGLQTRTGKSCRRSVLTRSAETESRTVWLTNNVLCESEDSSVSWDVTKYTANTSLVWSWNFRFFMACSFSFLLFLVLQLYH